MVDHITCINYFLLSNFKQRMQSKDFFFFLKASYNINENDKMATCQYITKQPKCLNTKLKGNLPIHEVKLLEQLHK